MKRFKWLLMGLLVLCLAMVPLAGCGVPQSEYEALQAENATLLDEIESLQADYDDVSNELAEIKEVYPPRDFSSLSELQDWLEANDVSEKPVTTYGEDWYGRALEVQEDALKDGYVVSADYDATEEGAAVWCTTIINGRVFYWDPETDEVFEEYAFGTVK